MSRSFVSTNDDLTPIAEWLRANVGGRADLGLLGQTGPLSWSFAGETEEFDPSVPPGGLHERVPRELGSPVRFATLEELNNELGTLKDDDVLSTLFAPAAPPPMLRLHPWSRQ